MREQLPEKLEEGRVRDGYYQSNTGDRYGAFLVMGPCGRHLSVLSSGEPWNDSKWEHVSVSTKNRCPNWLEMCFIKDLFWGEEECVIQFHPPQSKYINNHPYVLHLWKSPEKISLPPKWMV